MENTLAREYKESQRACLLVESDEFLFNKYWLLPWE